MTLLVLLQPKSSTRLCILKCIRLPDDCHEGTGLQASDALKDIRSLTLTATKKQSGTKLMDDISHWKLIPGACWACLLAGWDTQYKCVCVKENENHLIHHRQQQLQQ